MNKYTETALSFIESNSVRESIIKSGTVFSAKDAIPLVFHSEKPQVERFSVMMDILAETDAPEAQQLLGILKTLNEITNPNGNPHYLFREKYKSNPRFFLTAAQMKRFLEKDAERYLIADVYSHRKLVYSELCLCNNGVYDISCPPAVKKLFNNFQPPRISFFDAGDVVRNLADGSQWIVINADFSSDFYCHCPDLEIIDFSAMVIPFEYREYATTELIQKHYAERDPDVIDVITMQHEHLYIPLLELVTRAKDR